MYPDNRRYSREHEWVLIESDGRALVGITDYAQEQLGDVVFVELPEAGTQLDQSQKMGEVESVKAVSDLFTPLTGEVAEVNQALVDHPELINDDPHDKGWMVRLASVDAAQLDSLLSASEYESFLAELG
jgi:glycine cleavage system H protein